MSKAKVGDKFVIEVAEIIKGGETGCNQYRIKGFDKLFLDDKGLSFLESFDEEIILPVVKEEVKQEEVKVKAKAPLLIPLCQIHETYIVCQGEDGFYLIDQHAA